MKKYLIYSLVTVLFIAPLYADEAPGLICDDAPYVGAEYSAHLTPGKYWFRSTSYDFPFSVEYVWDRTKMNVSKYSPEFIVDFSCDTAQYEDTILYKVVQFAKDSLGKQIPATGHLKDNPENNYSRTFDSDYRVALYMFGITYNVPIYIQVEIKEEGDIYFNSSSGHAYCSGAGTTLNMDTSFSLTLADTVEIFRWPLAEWVKYNYKLVWTGTEELYVAEGEKCNVTRNNDMTMTDEHFFVDDYNGEYTLLANQSLRHAKDFKITDEFIRFYPEGSGEFLVKRLPTNINTFAMLDSTIFATIDQDKRVIKATLPKSAVPEVAIQQAKIIFEPADQEYYFNSDFTEIIIDDGIESRYTIDVQVVADDANNDATLKEITVDGVAITGFNPSVLEYTVDCQTVPVIAAVSNDPNAYDVRITQATDWNRTAEIIVYAEDVFTKLTYKVNINLPLHSDATLKSLKANDVSINGFSPEILRYEYNVKSAAAIPQIVGAANDYRAQSCETTRKAEKTILPDSSQVTCVAEDGSKLVYTVVFDQFLNIDATLSDLKVNGVTVNNFAPTKKTYSATVGSLPPVIEATTTDSKATYLILQPVLVDEVNNVYQYPVKVIAEDGETNMTYRINCSVDETANASLAAIYVDGQLIDGFSPDVFDYQLQLPAKPEITWELGNPEASATLSQKTANDITNYLITVTAANQTSKQDYSVTVIVKVMSSDASLSYISIDGGENQIEGFSADIYEYNINVDNVPDHSLVEAEANDPSANVSAQWTSNKQVVFSVKAEDATVQTYTVNFVLPENPDPSHDASLAMVGIVGGMSVQNPQAGQDISLTATSADFEVEWLTTDVNTIVDTTWFDDHSLMFLCVAEDGSTILTYDVVINIQDAPEPSHDATLKSLTIGGKTFTTFVEGGQPNTYAVSSLDGLSYETNNSQAQVSTSWSGNNLTLDVTAEDGVTKARYLFIFNVHEVSSDATLAYIQVFDQIITDFVPNIPNQITLPAIPAESDVVIVTTDPNATINATWNSPSVTIDVTAEDGVTTMRYVFIVNIPSLSGDNTLKSISLDDVVMADFVPTTYLYTITVEHLPVVSAVANDEAATVSVTQASSDNPMASIVVTAQNGDVKTYLVSFIVKEMQDASLIPLEVVFSNGFKGFIDADRRSIEVYYLSTETMPVGIKSWKAQEGYEIKSLELTSYNTLKVVSDNGEAVYAVSYLPVQYASVNSGITYYFDGTESYIKTAYYYTDSRGWRISKDVEDPDNRRISRGKDRIYFFLPGCAALQLNTTTSSRTVRISVNGEDITEKQVRYNRTEEAYYTGAQGDITYINGLTKNKPMMLEIEADGMSGDVAFKAMTLLANDAAGCEINELATVSFVDGVIINPDNLELSVYNVTGQLVSTASADIDLTSMPSMVYIIRYQNQVIKVVK